MVPRDVLGGPLLVALCFRPHTAPRVFPLPTLHPPRPQGCCSSSTITVSKARRAEMEAEKAAMAQGLAFADTSGDGMLDLDEVRW